METENIDKKNDIWLINIPILSISCPYSGRLMSGMLPFGGELVKDKCHHPMNVKWLLWMRKRKLPNKSQSMIRLLHLND